MSRTLTKRQATQLEEILRILTHARALMDTAIAALAALERTKPMRELAEERAGAFIVDDREQELAFLRELLEQDSPAPTVHGSGE